MPLDPPGSIGGFTGGKRRLIGLSLVHGPANLPHNKTQPRAAMFQAGSLYHFKEDIHENRRPNFRRFLHRGAPGCVYDFPFVLSHRIARDDAHRGTTEQGSGSGSFRDDRRWRSLCCVPRPPGHRSAEKAREKVSLNGVLFRSKFSDRV